MDAVSFVPPVLGPTGWVFIRALICEAMVKKAFSTLVEFFAEVSKKAMPSESANSLAVSVDTTRFGSKSLLFPTSSLFTFSEAYRLISCSHCLTLLKDSCAKRAANRRRIHEARRARTWARTVAPTVGLTAQENLRPAENSVTRAGRGPQRKVTDGCAAGRYPWTHLVSHVVYDDDAVGSSVVRGCDRAESLLSRRVPLSVVEQDGCVYRRKIKTTSHGTDSVIPKPSTQAPHRQLGPKPIEEVTIQILCLLYPRPRPFPSYASTAHTFSLIFAHLRFAV